MSPVILNLVIFKHFPSRHSTKGDITNGFTLRIEATVIACTRGFLLRGQRLNEENSVTSSDFGPVHTYPDVFKNGAFFLPFSKKSAFTRSVFKSFLPVHTYPDIFENGGFFLRFRENPSPHT